MTSHIDTVITDGVATISICRPDKFNAINNAMIDDLVDVFRQVGARDDTHVVVLRGEGKHFSAGGDMDDIAGMVDPDAVRRAEGMRQAVLSKSKPLALACQALPQPIVASVRGHAIGIGLQLVILADLVVASETARFTLPQLDLGHVPDHGETWTLPRKIGLARTMQMTFMAERIDAVTAERFNLVNWVVPDQELDDRTATVAKRIAAGPPLATRAAKALYSGSGGLSLGDAIEAEAAALAKVGAQQDFAEAIAAFQERRPPRFKGA